MSMSAMKTQMARRQPQLLHGQRTELLGVWVVGGDVGVAAADKQRKTRPLPRIVQRTELCPRWQRDTNGASLESLRRRRWMANHRKTPTTLPPWKDHHRAARPMRPADSTRRQARTWRRTAQSQNHRQRPPVAAGAVASAMATATAGGAPRVASASPGMPDGTARPPRTGRRPPPPTAAAGGAPQVIGGGGARRRGRDAAVQHPGLPLLPQWRQRRMSEHSPAHRRSCEI